MSQDLKLIPGSLASACWPATPQLLYNEMFALGVAQMGDITGIIISETAPNANDRDKAWIKLTAAGGPPAYPYPFKWYNTRWVAPHPYPASGNARIMWAGDVATLNVFDGGDAGVVSDTSGPMWEIDTDFAARVPIGPGTTAGGTVIAQGGTGGEDKHVLTEAEGAVGAHQHGFGVSNPTSDDAFFAKSGSNTVPTYSGYYITGSNGNIVQNQTSADLFTLKPGLDGAGVTSTGHNTLPPYKGIHIIKRTARIFLVGA